ncbi:hypothetical protein ACWPKO_17740 [Coraliomargarita sp. W4R53]
MFVFGLPFVVIGVWTTLMGIGIIEIDPTKLHVPLWVLTATGFVFLFGGLSIWGTSWRQVRTLKAIRKQKEKYPNEHAMADYVWNRNGYTPSRWKPARKSCRAAVFILVFASIPNWIAYYSGDAPMFLKLITILTNLIVIAVLFYAAKTVWHAIKFGKTRLEYPHFPLHLGETVDLSIQLPHRVRSPEHARLTLRCLNEYFEVSGHGKNRSKRLVHKILHETTQNLTAEQIMQYPGTLKASFELPIDAPSSALQAKSPHFWELEMKLALPGLDLEQAYLLPVYTYEK